MEDSPAGVKAALGKSLLSLLYFKISYSGGKKMDLVRARVSDVNHPGCHTHILKFTQIKQIIEKLWDYNNGSVIVKTTLRFLRRGLIVKFK